MPTFGRMSEVRVMKVPLGGRASRLGAVLEATAERLVAWLPARLAQVSSKPSGQLP